MKSALATIAFGLALGPAPGLAQSVPETALPAAPAVVLPDGPLPVGEATNLVFLAPLVGGLLGVAALAGGGGGATGSTTSTVNR